MIRKDFPKLGEHYFEQRLANGLLVRVIEKPGFAKRYAFVATDYGSIDAEFILDGKKYTTPQGVAHYLEHKMFDLPEGNAMQEFAKYAGANNAFTSYTMTAWSRPGILRKRACRKSAASSRRKSGCMTTARTLP